MKVDEHKLLDTGVLGPVPKAQIPLEAIKHLSLQRALPQPGY